MVTQVAPTEDIGFSPYEGFIEDVPYEGEQPSASAEPDESVESGEPAAEATDGTAPVAETLPAEPVAAQPEAAPAAPPAPVAEPVTPLPFVPPAVPQDLLPAIQDAVRATVEETAKAQAAAQYAAQQRRAWQAQDDDWKAQYLLDYHKQVAAHLKDDSPDAILRLAMQQAARETEQRVRGATAVETYQGLRQGLMRIPEVAEGMAKGEFDPFAKPTFSEMQVAVAEYLASRRTGGSSELAALKKQVKDLEAQIADRAEALVEQRLAAQRGAAPANDVGPLRSSTALNDDQIARLYSEGNPRVTDEMYAAMRKRKLQAQLNAVEG